MAPFGEQRADYRAAIIAQQVHNSACTKRSDLRKVDDFLAVRPRKQAMSWADVCAFMGGIADKPE